MGVNGIYGLSGSGLDVESMVKVGMLSKQSEYDKMQQKYTSNEWKKGEFLEMYGELQTFNNSTLSQYKMSNNMNARGASSADDSYVTATANANAAIMTHYVNIESLASNVYLIGSEMQRANTQSKVQNQLQSLLFTSIAKNAGNAEKIDIKYLDSEGNIVTKTVNATDTAIFFSLNDGKNGLLVSSDSNTVTATATPDFPTTEGQNKRVVDINTLAQAANIDTLSLTGTDTLSTLFEGWTLTEHNRFSASDVEDYFETATETIPNQVALSFTIGDGDTSTEVSYTYSELNNLITDTVSTFVSDLNSKIGDDVKVEATLTDGGKLNFRNTGTATGPDSKVIISFDIDKLNAAKTALATYNSSELSASYEEEKENAVAKVTGTTTADEATRAALEAAYDEFKGSVITDGQTLDDAEDDASAAALVAAFAAYEAAAEDAATGSNTAEVAAKQAAIAKAYELYEANQNITSDTAYNDLRDAAYASFKDSATGANSNSNPDLANTAIKNATAAAYDSYKTRKNTDTALTAAYTVYTNAVSGAVKAAYTDYGTSKDTDSALAAAYAQYKTDNATGTTTAASAIGAAYDSYKTNQDSAAALTAAFNVYKADSSVSTSTARTAAYTSYKGNQNYNNARDAAFDIYKTAEATNTYLQAAYNNISSGSATALTKAFDVYSATAIAALPTATTTAQKASNAAVTAAYTGYTSATHNARLAAAKTAAFAEYTNALSDTTTADKAKKAAYTSYGNNQNTANATTAAFAEYTNALSDTTTADKAKKAAYQNYESGTATALEKAFEAYTNAISGTATSDTAKKAAYQNYESGTATALEKAFEAYTNAIGTATTDASAKTAAYGAYNPTNTSAALTAALDIYKAVDNSGATSAAVEAAYSAIVSGNSATALTNAFAEYTNAITGNATSDTAKLAAYNAYANGNSASALSNALAKYQEAAAADTVTQTAYNNIGSGNSTTALNAAFATYTSAITGSETSDTAKLAAYNAYASGSSANALSNAFNAYSSTITNSNVLSAYQSAATSGGSAPDSATVLSSAFTNGITDSATLAAYNAYKSAIQEGKTDAEAQAAAVTAYGGTDTDAANAAASAAAAAYTNVKNAVDAAAAAYTAASGFASSAESDYQTATAAATAAYNDYTSASNFASSAATDYAKATTAASNAQSAKNSANTFITAAGNDYTTAGGFVTDAGNDYTTASGFVTDAGNDYTTASGFVTDAGNDYTTASGYASTAISNASSDYTKATADATAANTAYNTKAKNDADAAQSAYNNSQSAATKAKNSYKNATDAATDAAQAYTNSTTDATNAAADYASAEAIATEIGATITDSIKSDYDDSVDIATDTAKNAADGYETAKTESAASNNLHSYGTATRRLLLASVNSNTTPRFDAIASTSLENLVSDTSLNSARLIDNASTTGTVTITGANALGNITDPNGVAADVVIDNIDRQYFSGDGNTFTNGPVTYTAKNQTTGTTITNLGDQNIKITYQELLDGFSFNELASKINGQNTNARASYDSVQDRFYIYNKESGKESKVSIGIISDKEGGTTAEKIVGTITENLFDKFGFKESANGTLADNAIDFVQGIENTISGKNGTVKVDGVTYEIDSNKTTVNGVTYNFLDTMEPGKNITVSVTQDTAAIVDKVKSFVSDYNALMKKLYEWYDEKPNSDYKPLTASQKDAMKDEQIEKWEEKAKAGLLYHDKTLSKVISDLRSAISQNVEGITGKYNNIFAIGISTTGLKGQLTLDEDKLNAALAADPDAVYNIFAKLDGGETEYLVESGGRQFWTTNKSAGEVVKNNGVEVTRKNERASYNGVAQRLGDVFMAAMKNVRAVSGASADVTEDSELNNLMRELQTKMSNFKRMMAAFEKQLYKKYDAMESSLALLGAQLNYVMGAFQ